MKKPKILIIDDDEEFLSELKEMLELSGYEMTAISDSTRTTEITAVGSVDVILLDLKMPGKSGFELAYELSRFPGFQDVPILAMTGLYKEEYEPLFVTCGIKKCLKKPLHPLSVIAEIEAVLP